MGFGCWECWGSGHAICSMTCYFVLCRACHGQKAEKLKACMEAEPKAYTNAIEVMASQLFDIRNQGCRQWRCIVEQLPMGSEKGIGYLVWGISRAATCLQAGEPNKAHVVLLLLIAAVEQNCLDSSWTTALRTRRRHLLRTGKLALSLWASFVRIMLTPDWSILLGQQA